VQGGRGRKGGKGEMYCPGSFSPPPPIVFVIWVGGVDRSGGFLVCGGVEIETLMLVWGWVGWNDGSRSDPEPVSFLVVRSLWS